jgi:hypothetical protein
MVRNDQKNEVLKMLLGFLFISPALMLGAALVQGASMLSNGLSEPEKDGRVISF